MSDIALVYATFPDRDTAGNVAETIVGERLAACANMLADCTSVFHWDGKVARESETPVLFKTAIALTTPLRDRIAALHPYDLAVIEAWPASVSDAVFAWVAAETEG
ncbi:divalent-cation tolerance protein CutA [Stakelama tenebrarum]|uniref:Divalent-cation tolerance protein CutA n=1 Tax=Stakelama tenebrarum TaxID=2711215 RepID=A0A6G6Y3Y1_9SPHN|nr:divalent-cation tolerance protein CutA [Sphingosinithalassobacter tenebrarum]QIG79610.1 divalent-cation tolerance protein CutA [Sphingosinithalassobacter tenebrarum]